jgi:hypothetical protein
MATGVELDLRELDAAIHQLKGLLPKSYEQIVGRAAGSIAVKAFLTTIKANRNRVKLNMQQPIATMFRVRKRDGKKGKKGSIIMGSTVEIWEPTRLAYKIAMKQNGRLRFNNPYQFQKQAYKLATQRFMSVNFIRAGWIFAIAELSKFMKVGGILSIIKMARKKLKNPGKNKQGEGKMSPGSMDGAIAEIWNNALIKHDSARPHAQSALEASVRLETQQLQKQAEQILWSTFAKSKMTVGNAI